MRIFVLIGVVLLLAGCDRRPDSYPMPAQYSLAPSAADFMIEMGSPDAPASFVSDVRTGDASAGWRWTGRNPTFHLLVSAVGRLKYSADFSLWDTAMRQTGPVAITFLVNGKVLSRVRYDTPGAKHFEKAVPEGWLNAAKDTTFGAQIDKLYVAPRDGAKFGFILVRIGFLPA